jgi:hypothetical protein
VSGEPIMGHAGWPPDEEDDERRRRAALPLYRPTDPKLIDQRPYLEYAARREDRPS